jgi:hypothetical protein
VTEQWQFNRALQASKLKAITRALLMHMGVLANWPGGNIPDKYSPSLSKLVEITGFSRRAVQEHLNLAEEQGWIKRSRPTTARALGAGERTSYRLLIPDVRLVADALGQEAPYPRASDAPPRAGGALGTDQGNVRNEGNALGQEAPYPRAGGALPLGQEAPSTISSSISAAAAEAKGPVRKILEARPDLDLSHAERVLKRMLGNKDIQNPSGYVARIIASGDLDQYVEEAARRPAYAGPRCELALDTDGESCRNCQRPARHPTHQAAA